MVTRADYDALKTAIAAVSWRESRHGGTLHEYVMADVSAFHGELAWRMGLVLAAYGYPGEFAGRTWRYVDVDGWTYWMMPKPSWPFVVNRRRIRAEVRDGR